MTTILLILTGGTIGSIKKKNIINVSKSNYLKSFLLKSFKRQINFKIVSKMKPDKKTFNNLLLIYLD